MAEHLENVALIGASGNLGKATLNALLKEIKHNITIITRPSSTADYPSHVKVRKGQYSDAAFLESALKDHDVLVIMLGFSGLSDQDTIIRAAGRAGVKYVLPTEYGVSSGNEKQVKAIPMLQAKRDVHNQIEGLGMRWIAVVTNLWIDYCLEYGFFDIHVPERRATLYTDSAPFITSTIDRVGAGIAALLGLPVSSIEKDFSNNYLYISSFMLSQPEIFSTVLRASRTAEADWQIERKTTRDLINEGRELVKAGDSAGHFKILSGVAYQPGMGGDYSDLVHNKLLGLVEEEDLDEVVKIAVKAARPGAFAIASTLASPK